MGEEGHEPGHLCGRCYHMDKPGAGRRLRRGRLVRPCGESHLASSRKLGLSEKMSKSYPDEMEGEEGPGSGSKVSAARS